MLLHNRMLLFFENRIISPFALSIKYRTNLSSAFNTEYPPGFTASTTMTWQMQIFKSIHPVNTKVVFRNIGYNSHIGKVIPRPFLTIPPLAVSSTATSTSFDDNTIAALVGPVLSPFKTHSSPMKMLRWMSFPPFSPGRQEYARSVAWWSSFR